MGCVSIALHWILLYIKGYLESLNVTGIHLINNCASLIKIGDIEIRVNIVGQYLVDILPPTHNNRPQTGKYYTDPLGTAHTNLRVSHLDNLYCGENLFSPPPTTTACQDRLTLRLVWAVQKICLSGYLAIVSILLCLHVFVFFFHDRRGYKVNTPSILHGHEMIHYPLLVLGKSYSWM